MRRTWQCLTELASEVSTAQRNARAGCAPLALSKSQLSARLGACFQGRGKAVVSLHLSLEDVSFWAQIYACWDQRGALPTIPVNPALGTIVPWSQLISPGFPPRPASPFPAAWEGLGLQSSQGWPEGRK